MVDKVNQDWENIQTYFGALCHDIRQYSQAMEKKARVEEQVNEVIKKLSATKKEAKAIDATMMFTMMNEEHNKRIDQLCEQNTQAMGMAQ